LKHKTASVFKIVAFSILIAILNSTLCSCFITSNDSITDDNEITNEVEKMKANEMIIQDNKSIYRYDVEDSIVTMYLTVRKGNSTENTDHTWDEVNSLSIFDYELLGVERFGVEAILKIGDENGPLPGELGYGVTVPNAIVRVRGNTASRNPQKSYKIELKKGKGTWREQRTIILNKHPFDQTRVMNKLYFDLLRGVPNMVTARTQFVHLYVKDETGPDAATSVYKDYGLFTQIEQYNSRYLRNHGLDENGQLYKAEMFEFFRYEDAIKLKSDPGYSVKDFEKVLEIKGNDNHTKLIAMLEELNNYSIDIEEVFEKYFYIENYFTWLAYNILMGNLDTINRNFYLYSPTNSTKFYFIPWDSDGSFSRVRNEYLGIPNEYGHQIGISNYWGCVLHERVLSKQKYRDMLSSKIEELKDYLTKEKISNLLNSYKAVIKKYLYSMPDILYYSVTEDQFDGLYEAISNGVELNYQLYLESIKRPMPFFINKPIIENGKIKYSWQVAFDFNGEDIKYDVEIARNLAMTDLIASFKGIEIPVVETEMLPMGQYFVRVKAINESGEAQYAMDYYVSEYSRHYGIYAFYIQPDGTIETVHTT